MALLIDTSFLIAVASPKDINHIKARAALREMKGERIIPIPVLPEMFYLLSKRVNYAAALRIFTLVQTAGFHIQPLTPPDMSRMQQIMAQYQDNEFDFTDVAIMALAERLHIAEIYTFDRRDFSVFRPVHRDALRLLP
jgi:predicted nucleic acid-binding protein